LRLHHLERDAMYACRTLLQAQPKAESSKASPTSDKSEPDSIAHLRKGLEALKLSMEEYFVVTLDMAKLMPVENRKEFVKSIRQER
jgi:hypothetical protein